MKVVLFCGGLGTRLKEYSETIPKPMVEIGYRPLMWHLMRYYAHFGFKDFILCLGYRGDYIKKYFLNYDECMSNDFVMKNGGRDVQLYSNDIEDWTISFVDTGLHTNIGQRLLAVKDYLAGEDVFLANYSDGLADLDLKIYLENFYRNNKVACFLSVKPSQSFHVVSAGDDGRVTKIEPVAKSDIWINGGYFIFKKEIFNYIQEGEELVQEPFYRLLEQNQLITYKNQGFWACIDTLKEKKLFDDMYARGETPWAVWDTSPRNSLYHKNGYGNGKKLNGLSVNQTEIFTQDDPSVDVSPMF
jgi:glucose-1-phosphate cytidylyltransferase